jgi:ataxia telangiectasia mutated family protein
MNVFDILNQLIDREGKPLPGNRIRTYQVVPMSYLAGVIEWVPNTESLHEYVTVNHQQYHYIQEFNSRFYPKDLKHDQCKKLYASLHSKKNASAMHKEKMFEDLISRFHPVLRLGFFCRYTDPHSWYINFAVLI